MVRRGRSRWQVAGSIPRRNKLPRRQCAFAVCTSSNGWRSPFTHVCLCEGFRMTANHDDAVGTGAVVRKPPGKEPAGDGAVMARLLWGLAVADEPNDVGGSATDAVFAIATGSAPAEAGSFHGPDRQFATAQRWVRFQGEPDIGRPRPIPPLIRLNWGHAVTYLGGSGWSMPCSTEPARARRAASDIRSIGGRQ
jgi:hypothetical protein